MEERERIVNEIMKMLRIEFGIQTMEQLDKAIRTLSVIDLTPFCGAIHK